MTMSPLDHPSLQGQTHDLKSPMDNDEVQCWRQVEQAQAMAIDALKSRMQTSNATTDVGLDTGSPSTEAGCGTMLNIYSQPGKEV